jgi:hypothetical protein
MIVWGVVLVVSWPPSAHASGSLRAAADRAAAETGDLLAGASAAYQLGEPGLTDLLETRRAALAR